MLINLIHFLKEILFWRVETIKPSLLRVPVADFKIFYISFLCLFIFGIMSPKFNDCNVSEITKTFKFALPCKITIFCFHISFGYFHNINFSCAKTLNYEYMQDILVLQWKLIGIMLLILIIINLKRENSLLLAFSLLLQELIISSIFELWNILLYLTVTSILDILSILCLATLLTWESYTQLAIWHFFITFNDSHEHSAEMLTG